MTEKIDELQDKLIISVMQKLTESNKELIAISKSLNDEHGLMHKRIALLQEVVIQQNKRMNELEKRVNELEARMFVKDHVFH